MSRTAMSHAKWSVTSHNPRKHPLKLEDTKGERILRGILEDLQRVYPDLHFRSQDQGDFTLDETWVIECDGPSHLRQKRRDNDAWRDGELQKLGYVVIRFKEQEILKKAHLIRQILGSLHLLTRKETA